ncbi:hypothetical protein [Atopomonas sediminilitoris]|uniref:hypothetical protein n=1 Tax=Atopomonas sediminilitoris TaxID=2919919 RepID=UPI001F4E2506|nr:hypothetical protein [Atopomonas sediminilitoris]MCJ8170313.1 hypothetical protein [Atopomonas sediminilitoris]
MVDIPLLRTLPVVAKQFVYLVYGSNPAYHAEARLSILSLLAYQGLAEAERIVVYTDCAEPFAGWPVEVVHLSADCLQAWMGTAGYQHRRKAKAIEHALSCAEQSIFVDTDTFFKANANLLWQRLSKAVWLVDEIEGRWGDDTELNQAFAGFIEQHRPSNSRFFLVNSGVFGLKAEQRAVVEQALALIDTLYPLAPRLHTVEQFAFSLALADASRPADAQGVVKHYYSDKDHWRALARHFFALHGSTYSETLVAAFAEFPRVKPSASWYHRARFRLLSAGLDKRLAKAIRLAYYGAVLGGGYDDACALEYVREACRKLPALRDWQGGAALGARVQRLFAVGGVFARFNERRARVLAEDQA